MPELSSIERFGDRFILRYNFGILGGGESTAMAIDEYPGMGGIGRDVDEADADTSEDGDGDAGRDIGNGTAEGDAVELTSESTGSSCRNTAFLVFFDDFELRGFVYGVEPSGYSPVGGAGFSTTLGNPACGPVRFRTDEKCSQS